MKAFILVIMAIVISPSLPECSGGFFTCTGNVKKEIPCEMVCNGKQDCPWGDRSDEDISLCNDCNMPHLTKCPGQDASPPGEDYCGRSCDGKYDCGWKSRHDENATLCNDCKSSKNLFPWPELTKCKPSYNWKWEYCAKSCDGKNDCGDSSDEEIEMCKNCEDESLEKCIDGKSCVGINNRCDGEKDCEDSSDEWSERCNKCSGWNSFKCIDKDSKKDQCQPGWKKCNGVLHCEDYIDEKPALCDNCTKPKLAMCEDKKSCFALSKKCDGISDCSDSSDEWSSNCNNCSEENVFRCIFEGNDRCMSKKDYWCNGAANCDDYIDEQVDNCKNKSIENNLFKCKDDTFYIAHSSSLDWVCDGFPQCLDLSDETNCTQKQSSENTFHCKGTDLYISKKLMCNGLDNCPDRSDEEAAMCKEQQGKDTWECDDHSFLVRKKDLCDGKIACDDGSDEKQDHCSCYGHNMWRCGSGESCIRNELRCDGFKQCNDGSDEENCNGECYWRYPAMRDPFRKSCKTGSLKLQLIQLKKEYNSTCHSNSYFCDTNEDCKDGSDEANCPTYTYFGFRKSLMLTFLIYWIIFFIYLAFKKLIVLYVMLDLGNEKRPKISKFLTLYSWQDADSEFPITNKQFEVIMFNNSPHFITQFLDILVYNCFHPNKIHELLQIINNYMEQNFIFHADQFFTFLAIKVGPCSYTSSLLAYRSPPGKLDLIFYDVSMSFKQLPENIQEFLFLTYTFISTCFPLWDFVKDALFCLILKYIFEEGEEKSRAELLFLIIMFSSFIVSNLLRGIHCFNNRKYLSNTNFKSDSSKAILTLLMFLFSPFLPTFVILKTNFLQRHLRKLHNKYEKSEMTLADCLKEKFKIEEDIEHLRLIQSELNLIDATFEAIPQLLFSVNFLSFSSFNFYTFRGRYVYFYSVANAVLNLNNFTRIILFFGGVISSFFTAAYKFVSFSNLIENHALFLSHQFILMIYFLLTIFARVFTCFISITMPALNWNHFLQDDVYLEKRDLTYLLSDEIYREDFNVVRKRLLNTVSDNIYLNFTIVCFVFVGHIYLVFLYALIFVPAFKQMSFKRRTVNLIANIFVCVPIKDNWSRHERFQTYVLRFLHFVENIFMFYICLYVSSESSQISKHQLLLLTPVLVSHVLAASLIYYFEQHIHPMADTRRSCSQFPSDIPSYEEEEVEVYEPDIVEQGVQNVAICNNE